LSKRFRVIVVTPASAWVNMSDMVLLSNEM